MDEVVKILGSDLPAWAQVILISVAFGLQYFVMRKKKSDEIDKATKSLREKHLMIRSATESFFNEKYHIKKSVFQEQRGIASSILQNFINNLCSEYEEKLQGLNIETRDSELLLLAFDGFLGKIKEEIMNNVEKFITSKDFESDKYSDTDQGLTLVSKRISYHLNDIFSKRYSSKRYKVEFPSEMPTAPVDNMIKEIYNQAKGIYDQGELKIESLKKVYDDKTSAIIEGVI